MNLTKYQEAQVLHKHLSGDFKYRNGQGNKVSRGAWTRMLDALIENGLVDSYDATLTEKGLRFCDDNHLTIDLTMLD